MNDNNFNKNDNNEFTVTPSEFSSDFIIETENDRPQEFIASPEEFKPNDEQAAARDRYNDLSGAYGNTDDTTNDYDEYYNEIADTYDLETADDNNSAWNAETADDYGYETAENNNPEDETAATSDNWYNSDKPSAREKCKLDDYEIISDVLGSEKQIVKLYSTALCEAAEEQFRNVLRENLDYAAEDQYKAFEFMQNRGMYQTEQASENDISQAKQNLAPLTECNDYNCDCSECFCNTDKNCGDGSCDI